VTENANKYVYRQFNNLSMMKFKKAICLLLPGSSYINGKSEKRPTACLVLMQCLQVAAG
jgi:hypothetical protein